VVRCIRGQGHITDEDHLRFARAFGPLELPGVYRPDEPRRMAFGLYDASNFDINGEIVDRGSLRVKFAKGNELFHADCSFNDMPSKWSMLRGVIVPPERGETQFVDLRHVYDEMPHARRDRVEALVAEYSSAASRIKGGEPGRGYAPERDYPGGEASDGSHQSFRSQKPVVGSHAFRIDGMSDEDGAALIEEFLAFASQDKFVYSHKWRQGDLLIWDNRCALHRGTEFDYERYKRDLRQAM
jgi:alpha-ketoglutarate-dependent 2,4-dichlorophenoxyacetate dioxygenase